MLSLSHLAAFLFFIKTYLKLISIFLLEQSLSVSRKQYQSRVFERLSCNVLLGTNVLPWPVTCEQTCVTRPVGFICSNFDIFALSIGTKAIMESDINCWTDFFLSHPLPSRGCLLVETLGTLIEIATVRGNVHLVVHVGISVELQHKNIIDKYQTFLPSLLGLQETENLK